MNPPLQQELIKRDDQLSCLPHEHLVEDYKKMKTMKKKADQFANEARQTAQKVRLWVTLQAWEIAVSPVKWTVTEYVSTNSCTLKCKAVAKGRGLNI